MSQQAEDYAMRNNMLQQREEDVMRNDMLQQREDDAMRNTVIGRHVLQQSGEDIIENNVQGLSVNDILGSTDYLTDNNKLVGLDEDLEDYIDQDQANDGKSSDVFISVDIIVSWATAAQS